MDEIKAQRKRSKSLQKKGKAQKTFWRGRSSAILCAVVMVISILVRACRKVRQHHGGPRFGGGF